MSGKPLKVLSVSTSDWLGGAARAAYRIHQAVRDHGVDSRMFVKYKGTDDPAVLPLEDFIPHNPLYRCFDRIRNKAGNQWHRFRWGQYLKSQALYMSDLRSTDIGGALKKIDYDILHLHWVNLRFIPLEALPKDRPVVWTLHDSWPFCGVCHLPQDCTNYRTACGCCPILDSADPHDLSFSVYRRKKTIYDGLDLHIVTPSQWMADNARASSLLGHRDIQVIPNCIDTERFCPGEKAEACQSLGLDPDKKHILFAAMSAMKDKNKGYAFLKAALQQVASDISDQAELVLIGDNYTIEDGFNEMKVINLGVLRDMVSIVGAYRAADVTVVPSLSENLSCTIMESLSCGTPAVAFDIGGNGDMIRHRSNGYLAREKDPRDLADGIAWCLAQEGDGLSLSARQTVENLFTPQIIGAKYAGLYEQLMSRP